MATGQSVGAVLIANRIPGVIDAPIYDWTGTNRLSGNFAADLYAGRSTNAMSAVGRVTLGTGPDAGYFTGFSPLAYIFVAPGGTTYFQWRIWDSGKFYDYDAAVAAGVAHGSSKVFSSVVGTIDNPTPLKEFESFSMVAESFASIRFENFVPGIIDAPVIDVDGSRLSGEGFLAQCYARVATNRFAETGKFGPPMPFGEGARAGYWDPGDDPILVLTNLGAGQLIEVQVFVWEAAKGATFEEAARAMGKRGASKKLRIQTNPGVAADGEPDLLIGLESFQLGGPAPGLVLFRNFVEGELDVPLAGVGTAFVAQLYAGPRETEMRPVGSPAPFSAAGYWQAPGDGALSVPTVQAGDFATMQVRVWNRQLAETYENAVLLGPAGESPIFRVQTGGFGNPPSPPAVLRGFPSYFRLSEPHAVVIDFNRPPSEATLPILGPDGLPLSGPNFVAQIYANLHGFGPFLPLGDPAPFGISERAGYWQTEGDARRSINVPVGCCADIQLRIWDRTTGASYESATGEKAVSRTALYFATNIPQPVDDLLLDLLGVTWMEDFHFPTATIIQYGGRSPWIYEVNYNSFLTGSNWVAQLAVAPMGPGFDPISWFDVDPAKLTPVGPVAPVDQGRWQLPRNTAIVLTGLPTNHLAVAVLLVWEKNHGTSYLEAAANGSLIGNSFPAQFITGQSRLDPPVEVDFSSTFAIRGHRRVMIAPPGLSLLANPFARGQVFYISRIIPEAPEGTIIHVFQPQTQNYATAIFDFGRWTSPGLTIPSGRAFFVRNPSNQPITITFEGVEGTVGEIGAPVGKAQFFAVTCTEGEKCSLEQRLGFPLAEGDAAYRLVNGVWQVSHFSLGTWSSFTPELIGGEGLFVRLVPRPN